MFTTGQEKKQLRHCDIDAIQKFIQFMVLSKEMFAVESGDKDESDEDEFVLDWSSRFEL